MSAFLRGGNCFFLWDTFAITCKHLNMENCLWILPSLHYRHSWQKLIKHSSVQAKARMNRILYAINRSVITRLTSRSLSGQSRRIQAHHHFGFRLHLIWKCRREWNKKQKLLIRQEMCIERKFLTDEDLERNTLEGLSSCVFLSWGSFRSWRKRPILVIRDSRSPLNLTRLPLVNGK